MGSMTRALLGVACCMGMLGAVGAAAAAADGRPQQGANARGPGGPGMGGPGMGGPHGPPPSPERMFAEMDANRDGMVSKAEFMAHHARHRPPHGPGGPGGRDDGRRDGPPPPQRR